MKQNSPDAGLLTIGEFADIAGMSADTLRHYDKKDVLHPEKRGEGFHNNYRYYAPTQIMAAKMIRVLTEIGVPLQEVISLEKDRSPDVMIKLLRKHRDMLASEIAILQEAHSVVSTFTVPHQARF